MSATADPTWPSGQSASTAGSGRLVVLYDRDCGVCAFSARRLRRWDRHHRLELVALQSAATSGRPELERAARDRPLVEALHVIDEESGRVDAGGDAVLAIAIALPGGGMIRPLAAIPPFRWAMGVGYRLVSQNRHRIGRWLGLEGPVCVVGP
jgi:predicted DCC family thiol-disulfide oxidoreductase YuxK